MSDIINEIKEEINQERLETFFKKYLPYLVGAAIIFISAFGAGLWYKHYKTNKIYRDGGEYISAINKIRAQNLEDGIKKFEEIKEHDSNYAALANFNLASYAIFSKDPAKGSQILSEIVANSSYHATLRHLAEMLKIQTDLEAKIINNKEAIDALESYIKKNTEFKFSAQETLAVLYLNENLTEKALVLLNELTSDPKVPSGIIVRSNHYKALIVNRQ
ncbi:MAG: hypothetical protein K0R73_531 [Candidatus Midichloriaceae bacterium]|jgi:hypothetical protein|nr:hypothetical protein [Candidatus Midichloriaceae bacterium]